MKPETWRSILAVVSGCALAASDWPLRWTYLHFIALVPVLVGFMAFESPAKPDRRTGLIFAATYGGLLALSAATVPPVWIAVLWGVVQWSVAWAIVQRVLKFHWLLGPATAAATITLIELFVWHVIPIFGMAQCFARVTSATPWAIQFAAWTGLGGVVFALSFSQTLLASILAGLSQPDIHRTKKCVVLFGFVALLASVNYVRWQRPLGPEVRVAAFGWSGSHQLSLPMMCAAAKEQQAEILVTPELGFGVSQENPEDSLLSLASDIRQANLQAAIGVVRRDLRENQAILIDANDIAAYSKTHLVPLLESGPTGQGRRVSKCWAGVQCGVMICQDDNFSDLARGYAREGTQLMLVPTLDWNPICGLHFESSVMRSIENGYAICRAASGGISAVISPKGEVIHSHNHNVEQDATCVAAALTVGDGQPTLYARLGDWPVGLLSAVICGISFVVAKRGRRQ